MSQISRDPENLVEQTCGRHHQYPDGFMFFLELYLPLLKIEKKVRVLHIK